MVGVLLHKRRNVRGKVVKVEVHGPDCPVTQVAEALKTAGVDIDEGAGAEMIERARHLVGENGRRIFPVPKLPWHNKS